MDFDAQTFETMLRSFYVDDLFKSLNDEQSLCHLANELIEMCRRGGFRLTKFLSNSRAVMESLPEPERSAKVEFDLHVENFERALGTRWETTHDVITFSSVLKVGPVTKRGMMGTACAFYDPMGLLGPWLLIAKLLLQQLWLMGSDWDQPVNEDISKQWSKWIDSAQHAPEIKLSRCYNLSSQPIAEIQLHLFADASELAYGAVAYLRFIFKNGGFHVCLVMAKSKVAPLQTISMPRLELNSNVVAVRLSRHVVHEIDLPIQEVRFWTDSELSLQYITNKTQRFHVYIANRKSEINEHTENGQWRHVPGKLNPADLLSRGVDDPRKLQEENKHGTSWFTGPKFLWEDEEAWPTTKLEALDKGNPEIKRRSLLVALTLLKGTHTMNATKFSSWTALRRVTAWVLRFVKNTKRMKNRRAHRNVTQRKKKKKKTANVDDMDSGPLTCDELKAAEEVAVKDAQEEAFGEELLSLRAGKVLPKGNKLLPLSPFVDEKGILRVGGRLKNAPLPEASKHQIILPKEHAVTTLLICHEHRHNGHVGIEHVLANLREEYWVLGARVAIKREIRRCFFCQIRRAKLLYPYMADLPAGRVAYGEPPFTNCGVDLFGPMFIKQGRKRLKRYGVLFTCLTIRCVHLELVDFIDTDSFIDALHRFVNRRGRPEVMYSDRGTNFVGASTELQMVLEALDHEAISDFASRFNFRWQFNPPASPHMGGVWERLVRSVKQVMSGLMGEKEKVLTEPQLYTLLTEVESILNTRPLTHASDDIDDLEPLTPNHILLGRHRNWVYVTDKITERDVTSRKRWRQVQGLTERFWNRWKREYLPLLTKRTKAATPVPNLKVGDLVLVSDEDTKRRKWPLGRVVRSMPGDDGVVRVVDVKTKGGVYTRPVAKLYRLEDD